MAPVTPPTMRFGPPAVVEGEEGPAQVVRHHWRTEEVLPAEGRTADSGDVWICTTEPPSTSLTAFTPGAIAPTNAPPDAGKSPLHLGPGPLQAALARRQLEEGHKLPIDKIAAALATSAPPTPDYAGTPRPGQTGKRHSYGFRHAQTPANSPAQAAHDSLDAALNRLRANSSSSSAPSSDD